MDVFVVVVALLAHGCPLPTGKRGRRRLIPWQGIQIVQVVKRRTAKGLTMERRIVQGDERAVAACLKTSQGGSHINTACIKRLNATLRQCLVCLGRRSRSLARQTRRLQADMFLVGCVYNFCSDHASLRLPLWISERRCHWCSAPRLWLLVSPTIVGLFWNC